MILFNAEKIVKDSDEPRQNFLPSPCSDDLNYCISPPVRKNLPQTSNLIFAGKFQRKLKNYEESELSSQINLENDIEILSFPNEEKFIVSKSLRLLYYEIMEKYPYIQYQADYYGFKSEVYRYCFNENCNKIRVVSDVTSSDKLVILSKRPKIFKHEFFTSGSLKKSNLTNSYQVIDFNKSIPSVLTGRSPSKSKIIKFLKSPEKLPRVLNHYPSVPYLNTLAKMPSNSQDREKLMLKRYKKPNFIHSRKSKLTEYSKPTLKNEFLTIPPKLYYELMQVPEELRIFQSLHKEKYELNKK